MTTTAPAPAQIIKHCWRCQLETLHRLVAQLSGRPLYQCSKDCGAPAREVTDPQLATPAARELERSAREAEQRRWKDESERPERRSRKETKMAETKSDIREAIEEIARSAAAEAVPELDKPLDRAEIEQIVEEKLRELLGLAGRPARRQAAAEQAVVSCRHKNFMRKCASCQAKHAGQE